MPASGCFGMLIAFIPNLGGQFELKPNTTRKQRMIQPMSEARNHLIIGNVNSCLKREQHRPVVGDGIRPLESAESLRTNAWRGCVSGRGQREGRASCLVPGCDGID